VDLETELRDALWVNWALPARALPAPPPPLVLERLGRGDDEVGFVSLVCFRQRRLRLAVLPIVPLSFPQCNLRLLVRDAERVAAVYLLRELVPAWVVPMARLVGGQPASAAVFDIACEPGGEQRWRLSAGRPLALSAGPGAPSPSAPLAGSWPDTVAYFRDRPRAYLGSGRKMRRAETEHPRADAVPMRVEVLDESWLAARMPQVPAGLWLRPHSAFLIPSVKLSVALEPSVRAAVERPVPIPGRPAVG
jgi:hypothetical protein